MYENSHKIPGSPSVNHSRDFVQKKNNTDIDAITYPLFPILIVTKCENNGFS